MNYNITQYDLQNSIRFFFLREMDLSCDIVYDGYKMSETRPLVTIEPMQNNVESTTKQRESVQTLYRFQIGLRAGNGVEKSRLQERISNAFLFDKLPYYDTEKSADNPVGFFSVNLTAVVPMPSDDIAKHSERHRVYFDVEIENIKRGC